MVLLMSSFERKFPGNFGFGNINNGVSRSIAGTEMPQLYFAVALVELHEVAVEDTIGLAPGGYVGDRSFIAEEIAGSECVFLLPDRSCCCESWNEL